MSCSADAEIQRIIDCAKSARPPYLPMDQEQQYIEALCRWGIAHLQEKLADSRSQDVTALLNAKACVYTDCLRRARSDLNGIMRDAYGAPRYLFAVIGKRLDETLQLALARMATRLSSPQAYAQQEFVDSKHPDKGNVALLRNQTAVNFKIAERYLGIGPRGRQLAIKKGKLQVVGVGKSKKITVESLKNYTPPKENAN